MTTCELCGAEPADAGICRVCEHAFSELAADVAAWPVPMPGTDVVEPFSAWLARVTR